MSADVPTTPAPHATEQGPKVWARLQAFVTRRGLALCFVAMGLGLIAVVIEFGALSHDKDYWLIGLPGYITGLGTLALAGVTVWIAVTDRRRDDERANEARQDADGRATAEANRRRGELQRSYAREMIEAVEDIKTELPGIIKLSIADARLDDGVLAPMAATLRARDAMARLKNVTRTSAILCGNNEIRDRMAHLWVLSQQAQGVKPRSEPENAEAFMDRLKGDVITYCVFTIVGIEQWASYQDITGLNQLPPMLSAANTTVRYGRRAKSRSTGKP